MNAISIVENFNKIVNSGQAVRNERPNIEKADNSSRRRDELNPENIRRTVDELNRLTGNFNEKVQFGFHENSNRIVIKIIDKDTNEVVSEIPSKYSLKLLEHIQESIGLFIDESR